MNVLDMTIIRLAAGLVLLIAANIALGSINAIIDGEWDQTKFRNGCRVQLWQRRWSRSTSPGTSTPI